MVWKSLESAVELKVRRSGDVKLAALLLLVLGVARADFYQIRGVVTGDGGHPTLNTVVDGREWTGLLETDGLCSICSLDSGLISLSIDSFFSPSQPMTPHSAVFDTDTLTLEAYFTAPPGASLAIYQNHPFGEWFGMSDNNPHTFVWDQGPAPLGYYSVAAVPEPSSVALMCTVLFMIGWLFHRSGSCYF